ncbi:MAG: hypothetical protein LBL05_01525 [Synergistaceae bacterium]|jgi:xylulokinase|nr:hypothetical protein [Synergistaceae bacterium]
MGILSIDLGTTNIKAAYYSDDFLEQVIISHPVAYEKNGATVEFSAEIYFDTVVGLLRDCIDKAGNGERADVFQIVLTGQAESMVVLDKEGNPMRKAISWLDMRSTKECGELSRRFESDLCFHVTGQPHIIPTWPITKLLWLKRNEPDICENAHKYLLIKDYIIYLLTGKLVGEYTIYSFSHYFDIIKKRYWPDILDYCGIKHCQLPDLVEPCTVIGTLKPDIAKFIGATDTVRVNVGALDHFAGMIGTGNIRQGVVSESAGTVLSLASLLDKPLFGEYRIPIYAGPFPESYVLLPVCESGGISLEWFKNAFAEELPYSAIDSGAASRLNTDAPLFLPYITGNNAPDFDNDASGVFFGIRASHDRYDFSLGIMEGVACLLRKNVDFMRKAGIPVQNIISTGGGSKSALWSQLKADYTGCPISVPVDEEAPCFGAALVGAISEGIYTDYERAVNSCVKMKRTYNPSKSQYIEKRYELFSKIYTSLSPSFKFHRNIVY